MLLFTQKLYLNFKFQGNSQVVLKPKTSEEVSQIMRHCNARNLAVVPQAGNTSLGGGCIAVFDEIVVSTSLMNQIIKLDEITGNFLNISCTVISDHIF